MIRNLSISLLVSVPFLVVVSLAEAQQSASSSRESSRQSAQAAPRRAPARTRQTRRPAPRRRSMGRVPPGSQMQPSRERYREIQKALAERGYDPGPADGIWGSNSITALQDFQEAHGIEPTGWVDALSLIELGLGPQYETANASAEPADKSDTPAR